MRILPCPSLPAGRRRAPAALAACLALAFAASCGGDSNNNSQDMASPQSCTTEPAQTLACSVKAFKDATSHCEIINSTSDGVTGIDVTGVVLPLRNGDCSLPALPR